MGVARLSFGGACLVGMESGGMAGLFNMGGAAALLTGRWLADDGIARPSRGTLPADCCRAAPGMGGRSSGAGEDMIARSASVEREGLSSATVGRAVQRLSKRSAAPS